jgi:pimeloyl-ACP methyl ester carboxylesterase
MNRIRQVIITHIHCRRLAVLVLIFSIRLLGPLDVGAQEIKKQSGTVKRPSIVLKPCRLAGVNLEARCGEYDVYEDRLELRGRRIALRVVVLPALIAKPAPDALFILAGGPGQAATEQVDFIASTFVRVRQERDIVLVDQRGTGGSNGLHCNLYGETLQGSLGDLFPLSAIKACHNEWEQRADLSFYTTPLAMDDLDEVRAALGYERINIFGTSYGTRAAQAYLRQYPERVRSIILKGTAPISQSIPISIARHAQRSLDLVFEECFRSAACYKAFPNLKKEFAEVLARFDKGSVAVKLPNDENGKVENVELSRGAFVTTLRSLLQSTGTIAQLPLMINQMYKGDYVSYVRAVVSIRRGFSKNISIGMSLAVIKEDLRLIDREHALSEAEGTFMRDYYYQQLLSAGSLLPRAILPSGYREEVRSDVPVLLISGLLDPATPPENGEIVAQNLPNSRHVVVRQGSHSYTGLSPCVDYLMADFIIRGSAKELDTICTEALPQIRFQLSSN